MKIFSKYLKKYMIPFLIGIMCVIFEAVGDLLGPTLMAKIINTGIEQKSLSSITYWGGLMLVITAAGAGFAIVRNILASSVSQRMGADLRRDLFEKILNFSEESADRLESGSLITRMSNDTSQVTHFVNGLMRIFVKAPITCVGSIILASLLNFRLSLIIYGVVAIVALIITISMKMSYPRYSKLQGAIDKVNSVVQEYLIGIRLVKSFGTYSEEIERFEDANDDLRQLGVNAQMIITLASPLMSLVVGLGSVLVIYLGSRLFLIDLANPGDIVAFTIYMTQILHSLIMITNIFNIFVRTKASVQRINEVFDSEDDFEHGGEIIGLDGRVEFRDVTFAYPGGSGVPALRNLSFEVGHGQHMAVIGPTGSGKSTLAWLLLRFYDVGSGEILIGGRNVNSLNIDTVRSNVAIVPQKAMLFSGSVADNIRWGDQNAQDEEMVNAAKKAQADFVENMPQGYDSFLGSGGVNISGGQKQRISIARGILKNAPVLVLDDSTSALDAVTEARVRENLHDGEGDKTVITITQRCATAMFADKILVLDNGERVGFGTHDELMENCGIYRDIYMTQIESSKVI